MQATNVGYSSALSADFSCTKSMKESAACISDPFFLFVAMAVAGLCEVWRDAGETMGGRGFVGRARQRALPPLR
jgi:hypothetical protein